MQPQIGILCGNPGTGTMRPYVEAITKAGGEAHVVSVEHEIPPDLLDKMDGLLLPGGLSPHPHFCGETNSTTLTIKSLELDLAQIHCLQQAFTRGTPVLGIARGMEILNVAGGGTLRDILLTSARPLSHTINHVDARHAVMAVPGGSLHSAVGESIVAASNHSLGIGHLSEQFIVAGQASDGEIEAIQRKENPAQWGVLFSPERRADNKGIFDKFVSDCAAWHATRQTTVASG